MLCAEQLTKKYRTGEGVFNLNFKVSNGKIVGLVGTSGSGKTTLMRCLAGLLEPDEGRVLLDGSHPNTSEGRKKIAYLPEQADLIPDLTVVEQLHFKAMAFGHKGPSLERIVQEAIKAVNLGAYAEQLCGQLSAGQRRRVWLAWAVLQQAELYLLDDPTSGLDRKTQKWLKQWLDEQRLAGNSIVVATQHIHWIEDIADYCLVLEQGKIVKRKKRPNKLIVLDEKLLNRQD
ncbi:ABC-2 type transport system ATP-binding protein [Amphibacillus marinus]|uniref:ABC-2 type transport system ATP-binding protein n=1 Tax=Amphibacillus marinus TaxID=872970 RepID=A0A1H8M476_9BACI|nr:heme ABC exporter ATP-binding protein CcmA [Amphibacillus marinus]SEO12139.1 ABC-2 type transport system ATP-binding protein [Amphibacillus marinus]